MRLACGLAVSWDPGGGRGSGEKRATEGTHHGHLDHQFRDIGDGVELNKDSLVGKEHEADEQELQPGLETKHDARGPSPRER